MITKTLLALLTAITLTATVVATQAQAQAQTGSRGCVSHTMEEGALSAYPAWQVC